MKAISFNRAAILSSVIVVGFLASGCGQQAGKPSGGPTPMAEASHDGDDHSGWWCAEHGVPEEECSMCSAKAADGFKAKGDWCEDHNRAESQCFICDASKAEKFAKLYEAKFGHEPPARDVEE
ncbi:MAG: RND transporter [Planctomycetota bacterium]